MNQKNQRANSAGGRIEEQEYKSMVCGEGQATDGNKDCLREQVIKLPTSAC
jgi:hypothetical protein